MIEKEEWFFGEKQVDGLTGRGLAVQGGNAKCIGPGNGRITIGFEYAGKEVEELSKWETDPPVTMFAGSVEEPLVTRFKKPERTKCFDSAGWQNNVEHFVVHVFEREGKAAATVRRASPPKHPWIGEVTSHRTDGSLVRPDGRGE